MVKYEKEKLAREVQIVSILNQQEAGRASQGYLPVTWNL
jgi:hypothetical protein